MNKPTMPGRFVPTTLGQHDDFKKLVKNNPIEHDDARQEFHKTQFLLPNVMAQYDFTDPQNPKFVGFRVAVPQVRLSDDGGTYMTRIFCRRRIPSKFEQLPNFMEGIIPVAFKKGLDYHVQMGSDGKMQYAYQKHWISNHNPKTSYGIICFIRGEQAKNIWEDGKGNTFLLNTMLQVRMIRGSNIMADAVSVDFRHSPEDCLTPDEKAEIRQANWNERKALKNQPEQKKEIINVTLDLENDEVVSNEDEQEDNSVPPSVPQTTHEPEESELVQENEETTEPAVEVVKEEAPTPAVEVKTKKKKGNNKK